MLFLPPTCCFTEFMFNTKCCLGLPGPSWGSGGFCSLVSPALSSFSHDKKLPQTVGGKRVSWGLTTTHHWVMIEGNFITLHHKPKESQLSHLRTGKQETGHVHMAYWKKRALSLKLTRVGHVNKSQGAELGLCIQRDLPSNPNFLLNVAVAL